MSKMTPYELQCPHCGNTQETIVWQSINVTIDSKLKQKLLAGEINLFDCKKCGKKTFINVPLLYHDMKQRFFVQYYPPKALEDDEVLSQYTPDGSLSLINIPAAVTESDAYLTRPHIVFDIDEMIRYVAFRDRLVDLKKRINEQPVSR